MSAQQPRYSAEETARRGDEIYERTIRAQVEADHYGKVVAIDIETGAYAVDANALAAAHRLRAQHPDAEVELLDLCEIDVWWDGQWRMSKSNHTTLGHYPQAAGRGEACLRPAGCGLPVGDHKDRPYTVCQSFVV